MDSSIDIIIVNWNSGYQLRDCIESIYNADFNDIKITLTIIDNNSTDSSLDLIKKQKIPIKVIRNSANRGFAAACNQGSLQSAGEYILFLNPDTVLTKYSLAAPLWFMEKEENVKVGICGIQLISMTGEVTRSCARIPSALNFIAQGTGLSKFPWFRSTGVHMMDWDHVCSRRVDHVIGAFYLVRRSVFMELGGFDETFFVYLEDLDFSLRAKQAGWQSYYFTETQAFHKGGGSSEQAKAARLFYSLRSKILFGYKHFSWFSATLLTLSTFVIEPLCRIIYAAMSGSGEKIKETCKGYYMLLKESRSLMGQIGK